MSAQYLVDHYQSDCGNVMTTFRWPKIKIGITFEHQRMYGPGVSCPRQLLYVTPEIKGINNHNRSAYKILEIDSKEPNIRFPANNPFWNIMKKHRHYQYCHTLPIFINWFQSAKQKIYPGTFVDALFYNSLTHDRLLSIKEKKEAKLALEEIDGLYYRMFHDQNKLNDQVNDIYEKLKRQMIYCDDDIKRKISMKKLMNKYYNKNIKKHGVIFGSLHLTWFAKFKFAFNVIPIDEFRNTMNSDQYLDSILKHLDGVFHDIRGISKIVMGYCKECFLLPLEKLES